MLAINAAMFAVEICAGRMAALALQGAWVVLRQSLFELRSTGLFVPAE